MWKTSTRKTDTRKADTRKALSTDAFTGIGVAFLSAWLLLFGSAWVAAEECPNAAGGWCKKVNPEISGPPTHYILVWNATSGGGGIVEARLSGTNSGSAVKPGNLGKSSGAGNSPGYAATRESSGTEKTPITGTTQVWITVVEGAPPPYTCGPTRVQPTSESPATTEVNDIEDCN